MVDVPRSLTGLSAHAKPPLKKEYICKLLGGDDWTNDEDIRKDTGLKGALISKKGARVSENLYNKKTRTGRKAKTADTKCNALPTGTSTGRKCVQRGRLICMRAQQKYDVTPIICIV